jgi:dTDP-4-amino-4,6-dideoxygalactose transaminase
VLVDVDPDTATIDVNCLEDTLKTTRGPKIKAILVVHLYGRPADMPSVMDLADRYGLIVIEDCAQSHGATINGRQTGTWGQMASFSFYPTKNLGALGDAGAVATSDRRLAERARLLREYGWKERYVSSIPGMNTRLDEIQAAILRVKLRYLARENDRRRELARLYDSTLRETDVKTPPVQPGIDHVYHQYVIQSDRRDELRDRLEARHIRTLIHYPIPIHLQPAYRGKVHVAKSGLTRTESLCRRILSLPMHPHLDDEQVREVAGAIAQGLQ